MNIGNLFLDIVDELNEGTPLSVIFDEFVSDAS